MFVVISLLYIGYRFIKQETGNGDFYRECARMRHNTPEVRKAYEKRANESDGAVLFGWTVWIIFGLLVLCTLFQ